MSTQALKEKIRHHASLYYDHDKPEISDSTYDALLEELRAVEPDAPELHYLGRCVFRQEVPHISIMGSLDKARKTKEISKEILETPGVVTPKLDGMSVELRYVDGILRMAVSRGDGETGENITETVREIDNISDTLCIKKGLVRIRGEAVINREDFINIAEDGLANPRNSVSGALRGSDISAVKRRHVRFVAYDILSDTGNYSFDTYSGKITFLKKIGFDVPKAYGIHWQLDPTELSKALSEIENVRDSDTGPPIDGAVLRINDENLFRQLGYSHGCPKGAVAWKFEATGRVTRCLDIVWNTGRSGRCIPVGILDPVTLEGAAVSRATLSSCEFMENKKLSPGCLVVVRRANDVIPEIVDVVDSQGKPFEPVTACPSCAQPLAREGAHLVCYNSKCSARLINRVKNMLTVLKIKRLPEKALEKLFTGGLLGCTDICDLIHIAPAVVYGSGITGKTAENIINGLHMQAVPEHKAIQACGFNGVSAAYARKLVEGGLHVEDLLLCKNGVTPEISKRIRQIKGIGRAKAKDLEKSFTGDTTGIGILERMRALNLITRMDEEGKVLSGTTWVITGTLSVSRTAMEDFISGFGGEASHNLTNTVNGVIVGENPGSKLDKAKEKGTPVYTEEGFRLMVESLKLEEEKEGKTDA